MNVNAHQQENLLGSKWQSKGKNTKRGKMTKHKIRTNECAITLEDGRIWTGNLGKLKKSWTMTAPPPSDDK